MSLPIQVKNLASGQVLNLDVQGAESVESLQAALAASLDVPPDCQKLIFRGKQLQAGKKLSDYNIQPNALLHLVMKLKTSVSVNVRIVTGKVMTLDVNPAHKVRDVVAMVQELLAHELTGKPACLNFQGQRLAMDRPVADCRIPDKAVLHLVLVPQFYRSATPYVASDEGDRLRVYGDLGSLYARCGGIFGIAAFVDRCMDGWMADAALNANAAVATWHERAQRCGFKFLVTQLMGYLAGGPQCYTGKEMVTTHKHLNISTEQWASFMGVLHKICSDFGLPRDDVDDLTAVISSMMDDCVVAQGETAPPKPPEERIRGSSLYAAIGGVYPIALFVDRVIDALLSDSTVKIPFDGQKRNAASLKYLFTELLCHSAGGPEVLTSTRLTETRLLASSKEFFQLMRCAEAASDHIYIGRLRTQLMRCVYDSRDMILDPTRTDTADPQGLEAKVQKISRETHVPLVYIVGGGAVFLAGRERHFGDANPSQQEQCWRELGKLGFRRQRVLQVKSADEAAAGKSLNDATIQARAAGGGAFVAAQRRVHGDPRTLYGRGGGVFGLAALADRLMDVWMADSELNANAMVARWHNSGQKEGFKFLVTQVMGYLTGGPQRYTGKPMDLAHKHLNISQAQWDKFMADADVVFREFNMEETTQKELRGILESFCTQCVVVPGEKVPEDKGLCRQPPSGSSLYAQAGGVYPLARFVNELIESAFQERLKIFQDNTRTPAGLKYLVTELVCNAAGGPELVTSQGFDDAKLGVLASEWSCFIELAHGAAKLVWGEGSIAACVVQTLEEQRPELCIGSAQDSTATLARQRVRDAGYNMVEVTAAMLQCEGDADKAIELLASGWKPEVQRPNASAARCPFLSGAASSSSASGCPFMAGAAASASAASSSGDRSVVQKSTVMAGRVLGSTWQMRLDDLLLEPAELCCPITLCLFSNPVIASDGCSYERDFIARIAAAGRMSPATHEMLRPEFYSAQSLKDQVETFKSQRAAELLAFARDALDQQAEASAVLVGTALDRAKTYISGLPSEHQQELAAQYVELCRRVNRPLPANLLLHVDPAAKIPVHLQRADGKSGLLKVESAPGSSLRDLISQVSALASMSVNFMGQRLDQLKSLADYQVEGDNVLTLVAVPVACTEPTRPESGMASAAAERDRVYGEKGTLYARCGGIFGVSAFVDRCMDSWMANPVLNANAAVATWHGKAQRCGFKFLVTQLMGNLTGGPQTYTGRDMVAAHKHLNINAEQWASFMDDLGEICQEFGLPEADLRDLTAIIMSTMDDCVVSEGEQVPANPVKQARPGRTLYACLGGAYPLALFADRLVDAMLTDSRIHVPLDGVKRAEPSLKYLFTELCCYVSGGPETMTSMHDPETFLKLSSKELFFMVGAAGRAADHIESRALRNELTQALYKNMELILDPARSTPASTPLSFRCPKPGVQTNADMQRSLNEAGQALGLPVRFLYIPGGGLVGLDDGMTEAQQQQKLEIQKDHGFVPVATAAVKSADAAAAGAGNRGV